MRLNLMSMQLSTSMGRGDVRVGARGGGGQGDGARGGGGGGGGGGRPPFQVTPPRGPSRPAAVPVACELAQPPQLGPTWHEQLAHSLSLALERCLPTFPPPPPPQPHHSPTVRSRAAPPEEEGANAEYDDYMARHPPHHSPPYAAHPPRYEEAPPVPIYSFEDARSRMEANYAHAERAMAATFDNMELALTNQRQQTELEFARPAAEWEDHLLSARERFDRAISRARPREF